MATEVLHTNDHRRYGSRAFLRLELTDDAVTVVVHELGPPRGPDDGAVRVERWSAWLDRLEPPTLTDDRGVAYNLERRGSARGAGGNPHTDHLPMHATVAWHFLPRADRHTRRWTIDGRWTVERRRPG